MANQSATLSGKAPILTPADRKAIARLRASKRQTTGKEGDAGEKAGIRFALEQAEYSQLERLAQFKSGEGFNIHRTLTEKRFRDFAAIIGSSRAGCSDNEAIRQLEEEMREQYGDDVDSSDWMAGFVRGAASKYASLAPYL